MDCSAGRGKAKFCRAVSLLISLVRLEVFPTFVLLFSLTLTTYLRLLLSASKVCLKCVLVLWHVRMWLVFSSLWVISRLFIFSVLIVECAALNEAS
jgi:hypothetical protein